MAASRISFLVVSKEGEVMRFIHTKCGGNIDTKAKTCTRCHKQWNWFTWWMTATEIRPMPEVPGLRASKLKVSGEREPSRAQYAGWGNKVPGVSTIASRLPNWPRWARILVTLAFVGIVVGIVLLVRC